MRPVEQIGHNREAAFIISFFIYIILDIMGKQLQGVTALKCQIKTSFSFFEMKCQVEASVLWMIISECSE